MTDTVFLIMGITFFIVLIFTGIIYHIKQSKVIDNTVQNYYKEFGYEISYLSTLSITEKIKYGIPLIPLQFYTTTGFVRRTSKFFNRSHFRKVGTVDAGNNEQIRYVEVYFNSSNYDIKEFDFYEF